MLLSFKAEIRPSLKQREALHQHAGNARWAYNWALEKHNASYKAWKAAGTPKKWPWPTAISLHKELNQLKKVAKEDGGVPWMYEASKCAPQEALRDLQNAFKMVKKRVARYPRFKSRKSKRKFRLTVNIKVEHSYIQLPRIGKIRFQPGEKGYLPVGKYIQVSVSERAGRWFVSVLSKDEFPEPEHHGSAVGLDLGVRVLATLSDGTEYENPKALAKESKRLKKAQQDLSRKQKGSKNREKARSRVARVHYRVANIRQDSLHKATTAIAKLYGRVAIEDLKVSNMIRKGKHKRGLNRVVSDAAFGEFRRLLEYKGKLYGCEVIAINPAYTSRTCSSCFARNNPGSSKDYKCFTCGLEIDRDLNAAKNILVAASSSETLNARGADVRLDPVRVKAVGVEARIYYWHRMPWVEERQVQ